MTADGRSETVSLIAHERLLVGRKLPVKSVRSFQPVNA